MAYPTSHEIFMKISLSHWFGYHQILSSAACTVLKFYTDYLVSFTCTRAHVHPCEAAAITNPMKWMERFRWANLPHIPELCRESWFLLLEPTLQATMSKGLSIIETRKPVSDWKLRRGRQKYYGQQGKRQKWVEHLHQNSEANPQRHSVWGQVLWGVTYLQWLMLVISMLGL